MCTVCITFGWDDTPRPVQLELPIEDENGLPLNCWECGTATERRNGYRWCPRCRGAISVVTAA